MGIQHYLTLFNNHLGFLKMGYPQVAVGFDVVWSSIAWMIWTIPHFGKPSISRVFTQHLWGFGIWSSSQVLLGDESLMPQCGEYTPDIFTCKQNG